MSAVFPRSLRARLTLMLVALTTVGLLLLAVATTLITTTAVSSMVEDKLSSSMSSLVRSVDKQHYPPPGKGPKPFIEYTSQASGTVIVRMDDGAVIDSAVFADAAPASLSPQAIAAIEAKPWKNGEHCEFDIPGLGHYLVQVQDNEYGERLIAAVSLAEQKSAATWSTIVTVSVGILTLVGMGLATIFIVRRATRPLERVANAADVVSSLPLAQGAVEGIPRLSSDDTDDRTEAGRVAGAMNRMFEHVDEALSTRAETDRRMRQFVTDASHELRTPLAAIQGYAELTRQESDVLPPLTESSLARIEAESARMAMLVSDLLMLSRLDEGQGGLTSEPVDLCHLGLVSVNDARTVAPEWDWQTDLPDDPVFVEGDQPALTQIVSNLLHNAHTHTPEGTAVRLVVHPAVDGVVELVVADTGPGIEPEFETTLFERFARNDRSRSRRAGSTGLGLAIVKAFTEAQGGTVRYQRGDGSPDATGGATFIVRLPASGETNGPV